MENNSENNASFGWLKFSTTINNFFVFVFIELLRNARSTLGEEEAVVE